MPFARVVALLLAVGGLVSAAQPAAAQQVTCTDTRNDMRAVWISVVSNIDWPSRAGIGVAEQQQEYRAILDNAVRLRLDTVIVQVRPTADALWPSRLEPWSRWLTGTQGRDPGYDPLAFLVDEAHMRGMDFHAWFNPFRVDTRADPALLVPEHPARRHPEWTFAYGGQLYYDPGVPEARAFVIEAIMDAVTRYDIDAVHLDDYFYPYPKPGEPLPDGPTFERYRGGFTDIAAWRRDNVDQLVRGLSERIAATRPEVDFGISPFGIWRNQAADPRGSATGGTQSYDAIFANSYKWIKNDWVDYIAPQIYWESGHPVADYGTLVRWWAGVVEGTGVDLYVGQAAYKIGSSPAWDDAELTEHVALNRTIPQVKGDIFFSSRSLVTNAAAAMGRVSADHYPEMGCTSP
ncbi:glycoside hydrolase family 10 protein [Pseudonocardia sp. TRM90224]|uniref:glycoside hydrolase family 10 protein n=1 Tax=Pseudonocardia sp. TRM90224 TaxID=2812678 RepID=UPI001E525BD9|nr:family 10 glycosylhydrolase [Pseudonocardia sp. TRM90224]